MPVRWLAEAKDEYGLAVRVGRDGDDLVAEWIGLARLVVGPGGGDARFAAEPGAAAEDVAKIEHGAVPLFLRHVQGKLGLHGSAVALGGRSAVFLGASGQGKSTLAAAMCARRAAALVADDAVAVDREGELWLTTPLERDHWLDAAARAALGMRVSGGDAKSRVEPRVRASDASAIALVALLAYADVPSVRLVPLSPIEAVSALIPLVVRFVVDDADAQRRELDLLSELVAGVRMVRLERPRGLEHLDAAADAVVGALEDPLR